jgi:hypothetical protein
MAYKFIHLCHPETRDPCDSIIMNYDRFVFYPAFAIHACPRFRRQTSSGRQETFKWEILNGKWKISGGRQTGCALWGTSDVVFPAGYTLLCVIASFQRSCKNLCKGVMAQRIIGSCALSFFSFEPWLQLS